MGCRILFLNSFPQKKKKKEKKRKKKNTSRKKAKNRFCGHVFTYISSSIGPFVSKNNKVPPWMYRHQPYEFHENRFKTATCIVRSYIFVYIFFFWPSRDPPCDPSRNDCTSQCICDLTSPMIDVFQWYRYDLYWVLSCTSLMAPSILLIELANCCHIHFVIDGKDEIRAKIRLCTAGSILMLKN